MNFKFAQNPSLWLVWHDWILLSLNWSSVSIYTIFFFWSWYSIFVKKRFISMHRSLNVTTCLKHEDATVGGCFYSVMRANVLAQLHQPTLISSILMSIVWRRESCVSYRKPPVWSMNILCKPSVCWLDIYKSRSLFPNTTPLS